MISKVNWNQLKSKYFLACPSYECEDVFDNSPTNETSNVESPTNESTESVTEISTYTSMLDIMCEPETTSKLDIVMTEPDPSTKTSSETSDEIFLSENSSLPNLE